MSPKNRSKKKDATEAAGTEPAKDSKSESISMVAIAVAVLGVAVFALVFLLTDDPPERRSRTVPTVNDAETWEATAVDNVSVDPSRDYFVGPDDAPVTIVAFSDFECPYCKDASGEFAAVHERFPDDVRFVFKNYPLDQGCNPYVEQQVHMYACKAAVMARCAGAQDRFWEMHDAIFELEQMSVSGLDALPNELGLSMPDYDRCISGDDAKSAVEADVEDGKALGVTGTPAVYVNGRKAPSPRADSLATIVQHILSGSN